MHNLKLTSLLLLLLSLFIGPRVAWSVDTPATMLITGSLEASTTVTPGIGDKVVVLNRTTGALEATGSVLSRQGLFSVTIEKTSAFNDTPLTMQFQQSGSRYELLEGEEPADFNFRGGLVPTRVSTTLDVGGRAGDAIGDDGNSGGGGGGTGVGGGGLSGENLTGGGSGGQLPAAPVGFDINDDGRVDQLDIDIVKAVVAGDLVNDRADVNGDGLINTRDIIAIIKAVNIAERERRRALAKQATTHR